MPNLPLRLKRNIIYHSFSDRSGTVFFNINTGETLGLGFDAADMARILANEHALLSDANALKELVKVIDFPISCNNSDK
ncbi:hypothetical protein [Alishewanella sp. HL-SH05]|uniref:hypothetical protein n=1 Tax=Alishewanella sp. HL-SH05 TaxID=3461145 RepID=UPI00404341DC